VHVAIHRHLHQPVYWGEPVPSRPDQSQYAHDSQILKNNNQAFYGDTLQHPENQLVGGENSVFEKNDKRQAYQANIQSSIGAMSPADSGMTISFSGALQRNLWSFGRDNAYGYSPGWNNGNITARNWTTSGGKSRAGMVGMTYSHALSPLLPKSVLRKQIAMHRERTRKSFGMNSDLSDQSKGYWPVELAFSRHIIPVLLEFGYEWAMVPNSHIARTCPNYMEALAQPSAGAELKADPPNRADQLGPNVPLNQWYGANRDTFGNVFPVPFSYQAHRAQYVDPNTGQATSIVVVPQCDYHGYQSGFGPVGWSFIDDKITTYNDPSQPSLVSLANDGENFWGGGNSFWNEFAPQFMNEAGSHGKKATTIQQFLDEHPVPANDIIHVEDGSWLAADQGSPQFYRWLEPPRRISGVDWTDATTIFDLENGWHVDMRNWAVLLAGVNYCETAEQIVTEGGSQVLPWRIEEPYQDDGTSNNLNEAEKAWHFMMWGFDSGFMYFGTGLDDEVKQTVSANRAMDIARPVVTAGTDRTPPTLFKPQRFPWNPGGKGKGQYLGGLQSAGGTVGFSDDPWPQDFHVWTLAHDVSGCTNVTLKVRFDGDGENPMNNSENETYAGGPGVSAWTSIPMTRRILPKTDPTNDSGIRFFELPDEMAEYYSAEVTGYSNVLLDYYIEAEDTLGNMVRSDMQHVFVEGNGVPPVIPSHRSAYFCATEGSPVVSQDPAGADQNHSDDNFDFVTLGGFANPTNAGGFGQFGDIYINYDAEALYMGGTNLQLNADNDAAVLFLGLSSLPQNQFNFWNAGGTPQLLDYLHNVAFTRPMDIAILLGDEYGDGTFTNFSFTGGYNFGQGAFLLNATNFTPITTATVSQFDGSGTIATGSTDANSARTPTRWEVRLPWSALGATEIEDLDHLDLAGLLVSSGVGGPFGNDRYLSGNVLAAQVGSTEPLNVNNDHGFNFITVEPLAVCLPHGDTDMDGMTNRDELKAGTHPGDATSQFLIYGAHYGGTTAALTWTTVGGKRYRIEYSDDLRTMPFQTLTEIVEGDVPVGEESTESLDDSFIGPAYRAYRIRLVD
jgi:hypothetical protein